MSIECFFIMGGVFAALALGIAGDSAGVPKLARAACRIATLPVFLAGLGIAFAIHA